MTNPHVRSDGEGLVSTFYNDLHVYAIEAGKWFELTVAARKPTAAAAAAGGGGAAAESETAAASGSGAPGGAGGKPRKGGGKEGDEEAVDEEALDGSLRLLEVGGRRRNRNKDDDDDDDALLGTRKGLAAATAAPADGGLPPPPPPPAQAASALATAPVTAGASGAAGPTVVPSAVPSAMPSAVPSAVPSGEGPARTLVPCARMNAMAALRGSTLYVYGGLVEPEEASELTLSDLWCLDVQKMDGWSCLYEGEALETSLAKEEDDEDDDEGEEGESSDSDSDTDEETDEEGEGEGGKGDGSSSAAKTKSSSSSSSSSSASSAAAALLAAAPEEKLVALEQYLIGQLAPETAPGAQAGGSGGSGSAPGGSGSGGSSSAPGGAGAHEGASPAELKSWIKANCLSGSRPLAACPIARVIMRCVLSTARAREGRPLGVGAVSAITQWATLLRPYTKGSLAGREGTPAQLACVAEATTFCARHGWPAGVLPRLFMTLYEEDIVADATFEAWGKDASDETPGKDATLDTALVHAREFLAWIAEAEEEEEEEGEEED